MSKSHSNSLFCLASACLEIYPSLPFQPLSSRSQRQQDLGDALGIPLEKPSLPVRDPTAHPKVNASTYHPPQSTVWNNAGKSRTNAQNGVREIQLKRRRGNNAVAADTGLGRGTAGASGRVHRAAAN